MRTILDGLTVNKINESLLHTKELIGNTNRSMEALTSLIKPLTNILPNTEYELLDYLQGIVERTSMLCDLEYLTHPGNIYDLMNKTEKQRDEAYTELIQANTEYNLYIRSDEYINAQSAIVSHAKSHVEEDDDGDEYYVPPDYNPETDEVLAKLIQDFKPYEDKANNLLTKLSKAQNKWGELSYLYEIYSNQFEVLKRNETVVYVAPDDFEFLFYGSYEDQPDDWYKGTYTKYDGRLDYNYIDDVRGFYVKTYLGDDFSGEGINDQARWWDDYTKYNSPAFLFDRHEWTWNRVTYTDYITDDSYVPYYESILLNSTPYITPYDVVCNEGDNPTATKWGSHMYHLHTDGMVSYSLGQGKDWHTRWMIKVCYLDLTIYPNKKDFMPGYNILDFVDKDYPGK